MPEAAAILIPLYDLSNVKDTEFEAQWTALHEDHFQRSKVALATGLAEPSATVETSINTDASDTAVGAVLQQFLHGVWTPISREESSRYSLTTNHLGSCSTTYPISGPRVNSDISVLCRNSLAIYATLLELTM